VHGRPHRHPAHRTRGPTEVGETVGGSSCGNQLRPSGCSTEMISDGCTDANCKVLVKGVGSTCCQRPTRWGLWWLGPTVAAPGTRNGHIDLFCHVTPGQALATQLHDLIGGGGMCAQGDGAASAARLK
jgi:hypothetical protein